ncbi:hypothetical protein KC343_g13830 [Hortaea werneckii]|uniref:T6SS Phospholipase effector Tle1-like catalytic domain-containing protein n=1 Tax=Hortaea werneckii TaxID=91943 RepID=A0A3M7EXR2_HORWE|nr:hypothetical protein KC317_g5964 [Hortaea werneckii]KAI7605179.1 hypothetical protein KC343_g13830 [Hortaea werneckii]KAI7612361.1 hypothetical protein KC346_g7867 [Hortaea werneckii]KAI7644710.1 hypothetical protein KC319_g12225 [Hortaea werneckii]KAI7701543.1 hypothetical protein KC322_g7831 [Hortaea werneckii]
MGKVSPWASSCKYPMQTGPAPQPLTTDRLPRDIRAIRDAASYRPSGRTIVVCLDGTGDKFDNDNSNIVHLVGCLKKDDPGQVSYYQSGIGTYDGGGLTNGVAAAFDMAIGSGLGVHIRDAYKFLMQTYHEGDKICLFGFSRGAYTARCLAGMIHKVGLLPAHNSAQLPFAYEFYKDDTPHGWMMSGEFKRTFCTDVNVYFVGAFDSVASVGFIPRTLPLSSTPFNKPLYFRHAMALDERRAKFKVARYQDRDHIEPVADETPLIGAIHEQPEGAVRRFSEDLGADMLDEKDEVFHDAEEVQNTDILEVWFAGCHADVGGGAVGNDVRHKLSQIPLRWMLRQCFECDTGITFHTHRLAEEGIDVHTLWPKYTKLEQPLVDPPPHIVEKYEKGELGHIRRRRAALQSSKRYDGQDHYKLRIWKDEKEGIPADHWVPEQVEDYFDSLQPINDQLDVAKGWWLLEFLPVEVKLQNASQDEWTTRWAQNWGMFRPVMESDPNLHWTVRQRMKNQAGYQVRVRTNRDVAWRICV